MEAVVDVDGTGSSSDKGTDDFDEDVIGDPAVVDAKV
jgi:hypothetical protein